MYVPLTVIKNNPYTKYLFDSDFVHLSSDSRTRSIALASSPITFAPLTVPDVFSNLSNVASPEAGKKPVHE